MNLADQAQADACNEAMGKDVIPETDETEPNGSPFEDLVTASRSSYGLMLHENAEKFADARGRGNGRAELRALKRRDLWAYAASGGTGTDP